jgi:putative oxidoreductase
VSLLPVECAGLPGILVRGLSRLSWRLLFLPPVLRSSRAFPFMIQSFDQIGIGQWFRIVTGVVEIVGAIALVYPGWAAIGGLWLGFTMVCAAATLVFVLHSSPAPAAVLLALNSLIVYLRRDQLVTLAINARSYLF